MFVNRHHYFSYNLKHETSHVYWHALISNLALSLVFIFEPIYLYSIGYSLISILWFYVIVYISYSILIFAGAKFASRFGYKHSILWSNFIYVGYWVLLYFIRTEPVLFYIAPVFFALQKSFFWPAYDSEVSLSSVKRQRGREVSVLFVIGQLAFIVGPFLGGFISEDLGFFSLFIAASILMVASVYPLFLSRDIHAKHTFKLRNFWQMFKLYPRNFFGYFGYAEDLMVMSLWPVFIYIVVPDFFDVGAITMVATAVGTILMLYVGQLSDRKSKSDLLRKYSIVYGVTWLLRSLGNTLGTVIVFDSFTKAGKDLTTVPLTALTYENAGSQGPDHAIAYNVFYEFSLSIGKILTALLGILILSAGGGIFLVFAAVGVLTMLYGFLK